MPATRSLLLICLALGTSAVPARAGIDCYGSLAAYRLSHPNLSCSCSSASSMPSCSSGSVSSRSTRSKYASAKASLAAGLFGAVLESVLFDSGPSEADKQRVRQQAEAERKRAEAERLAAIERAREAEERHRTLLGALSSLPGAAPTGSTATSGGVRLTALDAASTMPSLPDFGGVFGFPSDEAAREWLAGPESLFASVWRPLPVAPPLPAVPVTQPSCTKPAQGCDIVLPAKPTVPVIRVGKMPPSMSAPPAEPEALRGTVVLLRSPSCIAPCDDEPYYLRAWGATGLPPEQVRSATLITLVDRLKKTGKVLVESAAMIALDAAPNEGLASGVKIVYNVREAADTVLTDSLKVAGYAGTRNTPPPELIPFEETAAPFAGDPEELRKLASGSKDRNKGLNTLVVESAWLAQKLRRIWVTPQ